MKYYALRISDDEIPMGKIPQVIDWAGYAHPDGENGFREINASNFLSSSVSLDYLLLDEKAKLTDFLFTYIFGGGSFLISKNVVEILQLSNLIKHRYFPISLKQHNHYVFQKEYYWFYFYSDLSKHINFSKSTFKIAEWVTKIIDIRKFVSLQSIHEFEKKGKPRHRVFIDRLFIDSKYCTEYDLFVVGGINFDCIITEQLKNKLEEKKITGYEVKEIDWLVVE